jgi:hypothetical protein
MKYHVELYCEQTLTTIVDGPAGMSENEIRDAALEQADDGEAEFICDSATTTFWPLDNKSNRCSAAYHA